MVLKLTDRGDNVLDQQTPVKVVIPEIKLTLSDLAYMRGLLPGNITCTCPSDKTRDRLIFLGLVEDAVFQPTTSEMKEYEEWRKERIATLKAAVKEQRWDIVDSAASDLRYDRKAPKERKGHRLTAAGQKLMRQGHSETKLSKKGCA